MWDDRLYDIAPLPLLSACTEGPLETGLDITRHGIDYTIYTPFLGGLSHAADSLAAIKKLCFEEKSIDLKELLDGVRSDWKDKEALRRVIMTRAPAYGNDIDDADILARRIAEHYIATMKKVGSSMQNKIVFNPGIGTFEHYIALGAILPATADGRSGQEPVASNASPTNGRALNGQTAALNSYLKLPLQDLPAGAPLDLGFNNHLSPFLEDVIKTFIQRRGNLLSISINNVETLKAAMQDPDKYRDLKIRDRRMEAFFVDLPPQYQKWQIQKYEQYAG